MAICGKRMSVAFSRNLSHLGCFLAVFGSGLSCIYPVISNYLRDHYNLTQSQVGVVAITSQIGESFHFPSALTFDSLGPTWTLAVGLILSGSGWFWIWWSSCQSVYTLPGFAQLAAMFFIIAFGRTYSYCAGFIAMLHNTSSNHRGKVTALLDALFEAAVLGMFFIYRWVVLKGNLDGSSNENSNFFLGLSVASLVLILLPLPLITILQPGEDTVGMKNGYLAIDDVTDTNFYEDNKTGARMDTQYFQTINKGPTCGLIFNLEYQLLLWGSALSTALAHFDLFNIASVTNALSIPQTQRYLLGVYKVSILLSRFLCGYLYDRVSHTKHSFSVLVALAVMSAIGQGLFLIPVGADYFLTLAYFISGFVEGGMYISAPIFVIEVFGLEHLGRNVSLIYTVKMFLTVVLQITYDRIYEYYATDNGNCVGVKCIIPAFVCSTILGLSAALLCGLFAWRILDICCLDK